MGWYNDGVWSGGVIPVSRLSTILAELETSVVEHRFYLGEYLGSGDGTYTWETIPRVSSGDRSGISTAGLGSRIAGIRASIEGLTESYLRTYINPTTLEAWTLSDLLSAAGYGSSWIVAERAQQADVWLQMKGVLEHLVYLKEQAIQAELFERVYNGHSRSGPSSFVTQEYVWDAFLSGWSSTPAWTGLNSQQKDLGLFGSRSLSFPTGNNLYGYQSFTWSRNTFTYDAESLPGTPYATHLTVRDTHGGWLAGYTYLVMPTLTAVVNGVEVEMDAALGSAQDRTLALETVPVDGVVVVEAEITDPSPLPSTNPFDAFAVLDASSRDLRITSCVVLHRLEPETHLTYG